MLLWCPLTAATQLERSAFSSSRASKIDHKNLFVCLGLTVGVKVNSEKHRDDRFHILLYLRKCPLQSAAGRADDLPQGTEHLTQEVLPRQKMKQS